MGAASATVMPPPVALVAPERVSSPSRAAKVEVSETGGTGQDLFVDDYLVGGVTMFDAQMGLLSAGK
jgi:hypothetical protein